MGLLLAAPGGVLLLRALSSHQRRPDSLTAVGPQPAWPDAATARAATAGRSAIVRTSRAAGWSHFPSEQPRAWPFQKLSWFGLVAGIVYLVLWMVMAVLQLNKLPSKGLPIHLQRTGVAVQPRPGVEPLLVRVEWEGRRAVRSLYIGSRRIPPEDFEKTLRNELARRPPTWPVYIEGAADLEWGMVANAIDELRGYQAEVMLLPRR